MPIRSTFSPIFTSQTLKLVGLQALLVAVYACFPLWLELRNSADTLLTLPSDIHAALGIILGWLLTFRSNVSYARWWEARTLWGGLVNASRNLAVQLSDYVRPSDPASSRCRRVIVAFPYALRDHLRSQASLQRLPGFADHQEQPAHLPSYLVSQLYDQFRTWKREQVIDGNELIVLDREASRLLDICGGCERIQNTRLIGSYRTFARQCVVLYLGTFPWGMVHDYGWWAIPLTAVIAYFMIGMETVAENVELPFGYDEDDLDLDRLCEVIDASVTEIFDRREQGPAVGG
jgi:putative membrane protein